MIQEIGPICVQSPTMGLSENMYFISIFEMWRTFEVKLVAITNVINPSPSTAHPRV